MLAQALDVGDQIPGGVVGEVGMRRGAPAAALVEQDDPVLFRVVELAHLRAAAAARAAMQQDHGLSVRIAALLVIQRVAVVDGELADVVWLDGGIEVAHVSGSVWMSRFNREPV